MQESPVPLQCPLPNVVISRDAAPGHWAFYFQGSSLPLSFSDMLSGSMHRVHIALQELQAIVLMQCRMSFHLSGNVITLLEDNSTAKDHLCNQGSTVSLFLSKVACHILSLTEKYGITFIPAYIPTNLNVEVNYHEEVYLKEWHLLPCIAEVAFQLQKQPEVDLLECSHTNQCQHYDTLENPLPQGALALNAFINCWTHQVSYAFPPHWFL